MFSDPKPSRPFVPLLCVLLCSLSCRRIHMAVLVCVLPPLWWLLMLSLSSSNRVPFKSFFLVAPSALSVPHLFVSLCLQYRLCVLPLLPVSTAAKKANTGATAWRYRTLATCRLSPSPTSSQRQGAGVVSPALLVLCSTCLCAFLLSYCGKPVDNGIRFSPIARVPERRLQEYQVVPLQVWAAYEALLLTTTAVAVGAAQRTTTR